jgi:hypothetical protein
MKKVDNFNASKWLVENKITFQSRLSEDKNEDLLSFIKNNESAIVNAFKDKDEYIVRLKNTRLNNKGNVIATPLFTDYEMVSSPNAMITLNGETYSIKDVTNNPDRFLDKTVIFQLNKDNRPQKRTIGMIEDNAVGFTEKNISKGVEILFSTSPIKNEGEEDRLGKVNINGKNIYWMLYNN